MRWTRKERKAARELERRIRKRLKRANRAKPDALDRQLAFEAELARWQKIELPSQTDPQTGKAFLDIETRTNKEFRRALLGDRSSFEQQFLGVPFPMENDDDDPGLQLERSIVDYQNRENARKQREAMHILSNQQQLWTHQHLKGKYLFYPPRTDNAVVSGTKFLNKEPSDEPVR